MYQERMKGYYPSVLQSIKEFQSIVDSEYPEFENVEDGKERIISDAYLSTMSEDRLKQWEKILGINTITGSTISDRRETVIARIRGQGKLNTSLIKTIVKTFTGADCNTWVSDNTLYVRLLPPRDGKDYILDNVINEIKIKVPAHLGCNISRAWQYWADVNSKLKNWEAVQVIYGTWESVLYDNQEKANQLDYSTLDSLYLG